MSKVVRIMKNKLMIAAMVAVMVFGTAMVPVHAATITTNVISVSAGHTYYVRVNNSKTELGYMYLKKESSYKVYNSFTASRACKETKVYVRGLSSESYSNNSVTSLVKGASVYVEKNGKGYTDATGYSSISY